MSQEMFLYKSNKFEPIVKITGLNFVPESADYPDTGEDSYRQKMRIVANTSTTPGANKLGAWFAAKCLDAAAGDDSGQVDNIYAVYFPIDSNGNAIISGNKRAGAPCPPFCDDEGADDLP